MQMEQLIEASERLKYNELSSDRFQNVIEEDKEKDSTEEELEKLVFGDTDAFKKNIKQYSAQDTGDTALFKDDSDTSYAKIENDLELANDADVGLLESHFVIQTINLHMNGRSSSMIQVLRIQVHCLPRHFASSLTMIAMIHLHGKIATMSGSEYLSHRFQDYGNYARLQMKTLSTGRSISDV